MNNQRRFVVQLIAFVLLTFGIVYWVSAGMPVPALVEKPMKPNAELPTFDPTGKAPKPIPKASPRDAGRIKKAIAAADVLIAAGESYMQKRCDEDIRRQLVKSAREYSRRWGGYVRAPTPELIAKKQRASRVIRNLFESNLFPLSEFSRNQISSFMAVAGYFDPEDPAMNALETGTDRLGRDMTRENFRDFLPSPNKMQDNCQSMK